MVLKDVELDWFGYRFLLMGLVCKSNLVLWLYRGIAASLYTWISTQHRFIC